MLQFRRREALTCGVMKPSPIPKPPLDKNLPTIIMNPPVLQLEEYFLTKLHVDFTFPPGVAQIEVKQMQSSFNYETGTHKETPKLRMLKLMGDFQELDPTGQPVGHHIECEILGFFSFTEST